VRICTLGDLLLDVIVRLERPLAAGDDAPAATRAGAGGQAANVAAWAASLGADARFVGKRADDAAGAVVAAELAGHGVELAGPVVSGRTGVVVSFVEPDGERSMASDRGVAPQLRADELEPAWFADCDVLHVSGYALFSEPICEAAARAADIVRENGGRVSVDLSAWTSIRDAGLRFDARVKALGPDVVFATEREWDALGGGVLYAVVKRGAGGCTVIDRGSRADYAALPADVVDTTGAGDALAAGFLAGGIGLGLEAAARCVAKLGAML
jgi:sugar/nucleoside kinase (ribokinase family)